MGTLGLSAWALSAALLAGALQAAPLTRAQALAALTQPEAAARLSAVGRLAEIGMKADADKLFEQMRDDDERVRESASAAIWQIWSRSGDAAVDKLFSRGLAQMQGADLIAALATFSEIVRRRPDFAEGWNKRATLYFLLGQNDKSLRDCGEVLKRNPKHFGALSGAGQIHLQLGHAREALGFFRRAVEFNPNLDGPAQMIPILEQHLMEKDKNTI